MFIYSSFESSYIFDVEFSLEDAYALFKPYLFNFSWSVNRVNLKLSDFNFLVFLGTFGAVFTLTFYVSFVFVGESTKSLRDSLDFIKKLSFCLLNLSEFFRLLLAKVYDL